MNKSIYDRSQYYFLMHRQLVAIVMAVVVVTLMCLGLHFTTLRNQSIVLNKKIRKVSRLSNKIQYEAAILANKIARSQDAVIVKDWILQQQLKKSRKVLVKE